MTADWPEGIGELEDFLRTKGLSFQRRGVVPQTSDILWQYGTDKITVRVIADRGIVWSAQGADIAGWPQEWYSASELQEMLDSAERDPLPRDDEMGVAQEMKIIEENWSAIVDAFSPTNREKDSYTAEKIAGRTSQEKILLINPHITHSPNGPRRSRFHGAAA